MILAIDFNNTIEDSQNPVEGKRMGPPMLGAVEALQDLHDAGHKLIIHTQMAATPSGYKAINDWLEFYDLDDLVYEITALKPWAHHYIDDKAIHHVNWAETLSELNV